MAARKIKRGAQPVTPRELSPFTHAIDDYVADMRAESRIASPHTESAYRYVLEVHADDVQGCEPAVVTKAQVKRTLARWENPRTRAQRHAVLQSFYDWAVHEDIRLDNPARAVRPTRARPKPKTRLTDDEIAALVRTASTDRRDRWAINLLLYTGARSAELRGLRRRDLTRDGFVRLFGKGGKERWVPVTAELQPLVNEILELVADDDHYVLPGRRSADPPRNTRYQEDPAKMLSGSALQRQVARIGRQSGVALEVHPHLLRHAFGDAVTRHVGARAAQAAMGHTSIETTIGSYVSDVRLDDLAQAFEGFTYRERTREPEKVA